MPFTYDYPRPMVTVDVAVLVRSERALEVALIRRGHDPFEGAWALPGGFIEMEERLVDSAKRELEEETGIRAKWLAPACFAGDPGRDPRGRTVSAVFYHVTWERPEVCAGDDAAAVAWFPIDSLPPLAFDHGDVLTAILLQVEKDALTTGLVFNALPVPFTESDFGDACAAVPGLGHLAPHARMVLTSLNGRGLVSEIDVPPEEPRLYRFNRNAWGDAPRPWTGWFSSLSR
jgi:8-oxo-dGTP diphosphatase